MRSVSDVIGARIREWHYGGKYRRHRRGCRICNPHGNPPPAPSSMRAAESEQMNSQTKEEMSV